MRFQKLMISTVISLWMDADRTIGRWGAFEVNINSLVTYRESCCHISLMLIDFLQLCSNIMELDCNGAQLQTKVLPSFRVCSVWDLQPPPLLSNYTWPYLESFHCYNELWFENVTINHNLRMSFCFVFRWVPKVGFLDQPRWACYSCTLMSPEESRRMAFSNAFSYLPKVSS